MATPTGGTFDIQALPDLPPGSKWEDNAVQMWVNLVNRTVRKIFMAHAVITPAAFSTQTSDQTFTVNGLIASMHVWITPPDLAAGVFIGYANCPADNTLKIRFVNLTGGAVTPTSGTYHTTGIAH